MCPEPSEIISHDYYKITLEQWFEKWSIGIAKDQVKDQAGNEQNRKKNECFIDEAYDSPPEAGS